jgi:hypothetical protein
LWRSAPTKRFGLDIKLQRLAAHRDARVELDRYPLMPETPEA